MSLSQPEIERYSRQMLIPRWGLEGQRKLKASKVLIAGLGGLGCLSSLYLAAAGVGKIILIDKEKFDLNNLNRQVLCSHRDLGRFKAEVAKEKLEALNPEIEVEAIVLGITENNVSDVMRDADVIVDGLDDWRTRFIINDYCVMRGIPFVHAGVSEFYGQITTLAPGNGPCLRCIFLREPPEVKVVPVLGATSALLASLQVMEVIKLITRIGKPLIGRMLFIDGEETVFETVEIMRNANCPICATYKSK